MSDISSPPAFNTRHQHKKTHAKKNHHHISTSSTTKNSIPSSPVLPIIDEHPPPKQNHSFHFPFQNIMGSKPADNSTLMIVPHDVIWTTPLFSCAKLPRYVYTMLCPCTALYSIFMDKLVDVHHYHPEQRLKHNDNQPTVKEMCCSCMSCLCLPGLGTGAAKILAEDNKKESHHFYDYLYYHPATEEEEVSSVLHDVCGCYPSDSTSDQTATSTSATCNDSLMFSMGCVLTSVCFIPATCIVRQITTQKYHPTNKHESYWRSGLVSCFAWPCGLVQVMDEIQWRESHTQEDLLINQHH
jgi:hypothetical protein